jgi:CheY-like chemotaxis protein
MRILVLDDNPVVLELSKASLVAAGFDVVTSNTPLGFSAVLAQYNPGLALIDVLMPALNGNHLVEISRKRRRRSTGRQQSVPPEGSECLFVLHSNLPEADLEILAGRCGADGFIRKSRTPAAIGKQVIEFLRSKNLAP